ncbi:hypothetical protein OROGR_010490 [Orobanche gracilis]
MSSRKYLCGNDKRKKKQKQEQLTQSLSGSLNKYFTSSNCIWRKKLFKVEIDKELSSKYDDARTDKWASYDIHREEYG